MCNFEEVEEVRYSEVRLIRKRVMKKVSSDTDINELKNIVKNVPNIFMLFCI